MKSWLDEIRQLLKHKWYVAALSLTAVCSYGFMITHQTIGIDDTPYEAYFIEGMSAYVGRWFTFLVNKVLPIGEFAPFMTDLLGVLVFMAAVTVWCALFKRIFRDRLPEWGYVLFSCLFLSNPLISEVYTYYLHNGVSIGYLFCGISMCSLLEGFDRRKSEGRWKASLTAFAVSALGLWIALGCYESFMIVYLVAVCIVFFSVRLKDKSFPVIRMLCAALGTAVAALLLRTMMVSCVTTVFGLEQMAEAAEQRSVGEMLGWLLQPGAFAEFAMALKRVFVMYGVFAYAYYPIAIYVLAAFCGVVYSVWRGIRNRDIWLPLLVLGAFIASYLLVPIEGKATLYRSAQFLPLFSAWGMTLGAYGVMGLVRGLTSKKGRLVPVLAEGLRTLTAAVLFVVVYNQCTEMNKWFYVDYLKYEDAKNTMNQVAYELEKNFDTSKQVIFTGVYEIPNSILADTYVPYGSETFYRMNRLTCMVDEHLLEKFYRTNGVWVPQTPSLSVIEWGRTAFGTGGELSRFFSMHGADIRTYTDEALYQQAVEESMDFPSFPAEGSIVDMGDYIIVHF